VRRTDRGRACPQQELRRAGLYDVAANLTAFACAVAASVLLDHWAPAMFSSVAIVCWLMLARRTFLARHR
jgi:hypothetical protein